jgi:hypothetical protein
MNKFGFVKIVVVLTILFLGVGILYAADSVPPELVKLFPDSLEFDKKGFEVDQTMNTTWKLEMNAFDKVPQTQLPLTYNIDIMVYNKNTPTAPMVIPTLQMAADETFKGIVAAKLHSGDPAYIGLETEIKELKTGKALIRDYVYKYVNPGDGDPIITKTHYNDIEFVLQWENISIQGHILHFAQGKEEAQKALTTLMFKLQKIYFDSYFK